MSPAVQSFVVPIWPVRPDAFSSYRSGFEVRTYRLCRRVLMFHRFDELERTPYLVRSTDFVYERGAIVTYLKAVIQAGYEWDTKCDRYRRATLPALDFDYTRPGLNSEIQAIDQDSLAGIPSGVLLEDTEVGLE